MLAVEVGVVVLELGEVTSAEACYHFLHEELGAYLLVGMEGLELDIFSLWLSLSSWLHDVDDPDSLLVKLGHLAPSDEWGRQGQGSDDIDEALSKTVVLEVAGLGDAEG
jgi:hypothetical protein